MTRIIFGQGEAAVVELLKGVGANGIPICRWEGIA